MTSDLESGLWQTLATRTSRRALLRGAALGGAGLAAAALIGCGDDDDDDDDDATTATATATQPSGGGATATAAPTEPAAGQPRPGGTFTYAVTTSRAGEADPHTSTSIAWSLYMWVGDQAVRRSRDGSEMTGQLVESWEIAPDGLAMTMNVRPNAKWQNKEPINGRDVTAEDIGWNFERIAGRFAGEGEENRYLRRSTVAGMETAEAVDAKTLSITFDRPRGSFLWGLGDGRNTMIPKELPDLVENINDPLSAVSSGPWIVDKYEEQVAATFVRNPDYWLKDRPYVDEVKWVWILDRTALMASFTQGDVSYFSGPNRVEQQALSTLGGDATRMTWPLSVLWPHWRFHTQTKPFDDPRVRLAIQRVPNYEESGNSFYGEGGWNYTGPLASGYGEAYRSEEIGKMPGWNPATKEADIAEAVKLMDAAGHPTGFSWTMLLGNPTQTTNWFDMSTRAIDAWKAVWPDMDVVMDLPSDTATFGSRQSSREGWEVINYTILGQPDAVLEMHSQYHSDGSRNYGQFSDPKIDELIDLASGQFDVDERAATLKEAQDLLIQEHMPIITVYAYKQLAYYRPEIKGVEEVHGLESGFEVGQRGREFYWIDK